MLGMMNDVENGEATFDLRSKSAEVKLKRD